MIFYDYYVLWNNLRLDLLLNCFLSGAHNDSCLHGNDYLPTNLTYDVIPKFATKTTNLEASLAS